MSVRLGLVLPPGWRGIPLVDTESADAAIRKMTDEIPLDDGQGARIRRELRESLLTEARRARANGSTLLGLSGPRSAPISGSLVVTPVDRRLDEDGVWADELTGDVTRGSVPAGRIIRTVELRRPTDRDAGSARLGDDLPTLSADYWLTSDQGRTVLIACSTPLVMHWEAMIGLFDAVMETARWLQAEQEDER